MCLSNGLISMLKMKSSNSNKISNMSSSILSKLYWIGYLEVIKICREHKAQQKHFETIRKEKCILKQYHIKFVQSFVTGHSGENFTAKDIYSGPVMELWRYYMLNK